MNKNEIIIHHGVNYPEMTKELLEKANLKDLIPAKHSRIGIKPNLVSPSEASYGATTHPEVVAGILEYLQEHGFANLVILEGSWVGDKTSEALEVCGYRALTEKYHVPFIDTQTDSHHLHDCGGMELDICDSAAEIEFMINVPVLKGHCQTKITCALKNMKGLLPNKEKRHFHSMGLHKPIAHLGVGIPQDFIVVDHICGDLDFEDGGNPIVTNTIFVARDPVLCDSYVCQLMHYNIQDVPYIPMAEALGVGNSNLSAANIHTLDREYTSSQLPYSRKVVEVSDAVEEVESCSACYGYLIPALDQLKQEGLLDKLNVKICIGQGYRKQTGILGIGNCTCCFQHHLEGCPPTEGQIYDFLKQYIQK